MRTTHSLRASHVTIAAALALGAAACTVGDDDAPLTPFDASFAVDGGADAGTRADAGPVDAAGPTGTCVEPGSTLGEFCRSSFDCADGCYCNGTEACIGGVCVAGEGPCDDGIECTADSCDELELSCVVEPDDSVCDDGNSCTGVEICDIDVGCIAGVPASCGDGNSCTLDSCDPETGCVHVLRDLDGDGFADARCEGGRDCDDDPRSGAGVNPSATEVCDNGLDDDCNGLFDVFDPVCTPANDTCSSPTLLPGAGRFEFSTLGTVDDYRLTCESSVGTRPDVVFALQLTEPRDVRLQLPGSPSGSVVELVPLASCEMPTSALGCAVRTSSTTSGVAFIEDVPPGDYAIRVAMPSENIYELQVDLETPVPPPPYDRCDPVTTTDVSAGGTFTGRFGALANDHPRPQCSTTFTTTLPEAAYRIVLTTPMDVRLVAEAFSTSGSSTTVAVALVRDCSVATAASTVACAYGSRPGGLEVLERELAPGTYYVLVEAGSSITPDYRLEVQVTPPVPRAPGDLCTTAVDITSAPGSADISRLENDGGLGCGGTTAPYRDAYFTFELTERSDVVVTTRTGSFHLMSVQNTCGDTTSERLCRAGTPEIVETLSGLSAGTYTVAVSTPQTSGTVNAEVSITPAPL